MEQLYGRLAALLAVKSLVTLALTAVFVCLALRGTVSGGDFLTGPRGARHHRRFRLRAHGGGHAH